MSNRDIAFQDWLNFRDNAKGTQYESIGYPEWVQMGMPTSPSSLTPYALSGVANTQWANVPQASLQNIKQGTPQGITAPTYTPNDFLLWERYKANGGTDPIAIWVQKGRNPTDPSYTTSQLSKGAELEKQRILALQNTPNVPTNVYGVPTGLSPKTTTSTVTPSTTTNVDTSGKIATEELDKLGNNSTVNNPMQMPTQALPTGYVWTWDTGGQSWYPEYKGASASQTPQKSIGQPTGIGDTVYGLPFKRPDGSMWVYQTDGSLVPAGNAPETNTPYQQAQLDYQKQQADLAQQRWGTEQSQWNANFNQQQLQRSQDYALNQQQFAWQQQQATDTAKAQKQARLASLAAEPINWLQYSAEIGATPAVQPWQLPLMSEQYAGTVAGAALPGWQSMEQQGDKFTMANLPALTNPSMQYWSRMTPSSQQQYYGYEQARTGAKPEDIAWQQYKTSAPSGQNAGLRWMS
jgi:hypothetical protein